MVLAEKHKDIVIIGAGEQGRVILDYLKNFQKYKVIGFLDDNMKGNVNGFPVLGKIKNAKFSEEHSYIVALGDNHLRAEIIEKLKKEQIDLISVIHPSAIISKTAGIGKGVIIGVGAIVCNNVRIGNGVIVDTGSIIEHDSNLEDYTNISPGSVLVSGNHIGEYAWIGAHATVNEDVKIGKNCIIGAGSLVLNEVKDNSLVFGVPARLEGYVDEKGKHQYRKNK